VIAALRIVHEERRLRRPVATARGDLETRTVLQVRVIAEDGAQGLGEASPLPAFRAGSVAGAFRTLGEACRQLPGRTVAEARKEVAARLGDATARWALDVALADLEAQRAGVCLARHLDFGAAHEVLVNALLTAREPAALEAEAAQRRSEGFTTLKLKVGQGVGPEDVDRVAAVRAGAGLRVALRLDANGAWDEAEAIRRLAALALFDPEFVEQPVPPGPPAVLARVRRATRVPIAADEALRDAAAAEALCAAQACDVFVLKPAALGPIEVTRKLAARAREAGIDVVLTSLLDGEVSQLAGLHLGAALRLERACGFGPVLEGDTRPRVAEGRVAIP
jgi:o-succinylbenzoate synthase